MWWGIYFIFTILCIIFLLIGFLRQVVFPCNNSYFLEKTFLEIADIMKEADVPVVPIYGTLLGLIRENGMLEHEYDIDLGKENTNKLFFKNFIPIKFAYFHYSDKGDDRKIACRLFVDYGLSGSSFLNLIQPCNPSDRRACA